MISCKLALLSAVDTKQNLSICSEFRKPAPALRCSFFPASFPWMIFIKGLDVLTYTSENHCT